MAVGVSTKTKSPLIDKQWLKQKFAESDARTGFTVDPSVTVQQVRDMMRADGIRPEDNVFSSEIIRQRNGEK